MTQEVQVLLTLEVDVTQSKSDIIDSFEQWLHKHHRMDMISINVKEESEIYNTEENEEHTPLYQAFIGKNPRKNNNISPK